MWRVLSLVLLAVSVRLFVGLQGHSGRARPPLYGDFEAQRHWCEVTAHLPVGEWYAGRHAANELAYWGLDYPPLTAYHARLVGALGSRLQPHSFALGRSRGAEDAATVQLMRASVVASDALVYLPAVLLWHAGRASPAAAFALLQPALLLVDHGHFQYNGVCLGLVALAAALMGADADSLSGQLLGSAMFVMALNFKHMAMYYALAFFCFLLSRACRLGSLRAAVARVALLGVVVIGTTALIWAPLIASGSAVAAFQRLFPLQRGLFEDKVANAWCALEPLLRLRQRFDTGQLFGIAAVATLSAAAPGCILVLLRPSRRMLMLGLASCSLAFFLFAFQVHEKNFLMPLLPVSLLFEDHPAMVLWSVIVGLFSMFPLLERDGLVIGYTVFQAMMAVGLGYYNRKSLVTLLPAIAIHALMVFREPPSHLPHLWIMAVMLYSFCCFALLYVMVLRLQWIEWRAPARKMKMA